MKKIILYFSLFLNPLLFYAQVNPSCPYLGFDSLSIGGYTSLQGWQLNEGQYNTPNHPVSGVCYSHSAALTSSVQVVSTPYTLAPNSLNWQNGITIPVSPFMGNKAVEFHPHYDGPNYRFIRAEQSIPVSAANQFLQLAYFTVIRGTNHSCCDFEYLKIELRDCSNNLIPNSTTTVIPYSPVNGACANSAILPAGMSIYTTSPLPTVYTPNWNINTYNLNQYIGSCVKVTIEVGSCTAAGHAIRAFFDGGCAASAYSGNGTLSGNNYIVCNNAATLTSLPANSYTWTGPGGLLGNNRSIVTSSSGLYTLSIGNPGGLPITQTINLIVGNTPTINLTSSSNILCVGQSATLAVNGVGINTYAWSSGANSPSISVTPGVNSVYTFTANAATCPATGSLSLQVSNCTGVRDLQHSKNHIIVFPNPNSGSFNIRSETNSLALIIDVTGRILKEIKLSTDERFTAKITNLEKGIYFVKAGSTIIRVIVSD